MIIEISSNDFLLLFYRGRKMFQTKVAELITKNAFHSKQDFDTTNNYSEIALSLSKQRGKKGQAL
jgi:hypothetical protein